MTILHLACQHGLLITAVSLSLLHGANPNVRDDRNNKPLHFACQLCNVDDSIMRLIAAYERIVEAYCR